MNDFKINILEEQRKLDNIYRHIPLQDIPWNTETPPDVLVELIESRTIRPCRCIDLGCGAGNFAIYLSKKGFNATGVDFSDEAIKIASKNARKAGAKCTFMKSDMLGDMTEVEGTFDFAFDWEVLHHIYPEYRDKYVRNVKRILSPHGKYLSVCFSEKSPHFGGIGKYRETPLGTILYFSSEEELRELFSNYFKLIELKTIEVPGKHVTHVANYAFMEKS